MNPTPDVWFSLEIWLLLGLIPAFAATLSLFSDRLDRHNLRRADVLNCAAVFALMVLFGPFSLLLWLSDILRPVTRRRHPTG